MLDDFFRRDIPTVSNDEILKCITCYNVGYAHTKPYNERDIGRFLKCEYSIKPVKLKNSEEMFYKYVNPPWYDSDSSDSEC